MFAEDDRWICFVDRSVENLNDDFIVEKEERCEAKRRSVDKERRRRATPGTIITEE